MNLREQIEALPSPFCGLPYLVYRADVLKLLGEGVVAPAAPREQPRACDCAMPDPVMQADGRFYCYTCSFQTGARPRHLEPEETMRRLAEAERPRHDAAQRVENLEAEVTYLREQNRAYTHKHPTKGGCTSCGEPDCCPPQECAYRDQFATLSQELAPLKLKEAEARSAQLAAYVQHKSDCDLVTWPNGVLVNSGPSWGEGTVSRESVDCTCGLSALLAAADPAPPAQED